MKCMRPHLLCMIGALIAVTLPGALAQAAAVDNAVDLPLAESRLAAAEDAYFQGDLETALTNSLETGRLLARLGKGGLAVQAFLIAYACGGPSGSAPPSAAAAVEALKNPPKALLGLADTQRSLRSANQGDTQSAQLSMARADEHLRQALEEVTEDRGRAFILGIAGLRARLRGDLGTARQRHQEALGAFTRAGLTKWTLHTELMLGGIELSLGPAEVPAAVARFERVSTEAQRQQIPFLEAMAASQLANQLQGQSQNRAAAARWAVAGRLFVERRRFDYAAHTCLLELQLAHFTVHETVTTEKTPERCLSLVKQVTSGFERANLLWLGGTLVDQLLLQSIQVRLVRSGDPTRALSFDPLALKKQLLPLEENQEREALALLDETLRLIEIEIEDPVSRRQLSARARAQRAEVHTRLGNYAAALRDLDAAMPDSLPGPLVHPLAARLRLYIALLERQGRVEEALAMQAQLAQRTNHPLVYRQFAERLLELAGVPPGELLVRGPKKLTPAAQRYLDWAKRIAMQLDTEGRGSSDVKYLRARIAAYQGGNQQQLTQSVLEYVEWLFTQSSPAVRARSMAALRQAIALVPPTNAAQRVRLDCELGLRLSEDPDKRSEALTVLRSCYKLAEQTRVPESALAAQLGLARLFAFDKQAAEAQQSLRLAQSFAAQLQFDKDHGTALFERLEDFADKLNESMLPDRRQLVIEILKVGIVLVAGSKHPDWVERWQSKVRVICGYAEEYQTSREPTDVLLSEWMQALASLNEGDSKEASARMLSAGRASLDDALVELRPSLFKSAVAIFRTYNNPPAYARFLAVLSVKKLKGTTALAAVSKLSEEIAAKLPTAKLPPELSEALRPFHPEPNWLTWPIP